jgi:hypothetical protein
METMQFSETLSSTDASFKVTTGDDLKFHCMPWPARFVNHHFPKVLFSLSPEVLLHIYQLDFLIASTINQYKLTEALKESTKSSGNLLESQDGSGDQA